MRRQIVHEGAEQLTYEIREIVAVAHEFERLGVEITWENIGDPIQKGEQMPLWIKEMSWPTSTVTLDLEREAIEKAPAFEKDTLVDRAYEEGLFQAYGKTPYWSQTP